MAKRKEHPKAQTRKAAALSRKEAEQRRMILLALGGVALLVLIVLVVGVVQTYILQPQKPVAVVDDVKITRQDYQKRVRYERYLLDERAALIQQQVQKLSQSLQDAPELLQQFKQQASDQYNQILQQRAAVDRDALDLMIEEQLVVNEAARRGITVSEEEVTQSYQEIAAARSGGYTEAAARESVTARQNATATAARFTPTPPPEGETPVPPPTPSPTPTINVLSGDALAQAIQTWETTMQERAGMTPADLRELVRRRLLRQKLLESFGEEVNPVALQIRARHILVGTEEEALAVKKRLEAGEDFAAVAAEVSQDTSSPDGDLGWFPRGTMIPEFEEVAFNLEVGELSDPVKTQFGWHIIQVLEKGERELDELNILRQRNGLYNDWLDEARSTRVEEFWTIDDVPPDPNNPLRATP